MGQNSRGQRILLIALMLFSIVMNAKTNKGMIFRIDESRHNVDVKFGKIVDAGLKDSTITIYRAPDKIYKTIEASVKQRYIENLNQGKLITVDYIDKTETAIYADDEIVYYENSWGKRDAIQINGKHLPYETQLKGKRRDTYDDDGKCIGAVYYNPNGKIIRAWSKGKTKDGGTKTEYYNQIGNVEKTITYDSDRSIRNEKTNYTNFTFNLEYDNLGRLIKETHSDIQTISYKYDDYGNIIEECCNNQLSCRVTKSIYKYQYDQYGNWIRKEEWINDTPVSIITRNIVYAAKAEDYNSMLNNLQYEPPYGAIRDNFICKMVAYNVFELKNMSGSIAESNISEDGRYNFLLKDKTNIGSYEFDEVNHVDLRNDYEITDAYNYRSCKNCTAWLIECYRAHGMTPNSGWGGLIGASKASFKILVIEKDGEYIAYKLDKKAYKAVNLKVD